jgi:hypothetical protein
MTEHTNPSTTETPKRRRSSRFGRFLTAFVLAGTLLGVLSGGRADALSDKTPQAWRQVGDCWIGVGAHYDPNRGAAIAGADVPCSGRHAYTTVRLYLYWHPYTGGSWQIVSSSSTTFTNSYGLGSRELTTPPVCGGGYSWWQSYAVVTIAGYGTYTIANPVTAWRTLC